jgi:predicted DNA-binding protein
MHTRASDSERKSADEARVALRVGRAERDRLNRLAELHDRTLSSEIRRAIRFYLTNTETVDRALGEQTEEIG